MELTTTISTLGYLVGVAGAITVIFSRVKTENLKDLKERVDILERDREEARKQHLENQKSISMLRGKLDAYREIPLKFIPEALEQLIRSNNLILASLQNSAATLLNEKHGSGLLAKTEQAKPLDVKVKSKE